MTDLGEIARLPLTEFKDALRSFAVSNIASDLLLYVGILGRTDWASALQAVFEVIGHSPYLSEARSNTFRAALLRARADLARTFLRQWPGDNLWEEVSLGNLQRIMTLRTSWVLYEQRHTARLWLPPVVTDVIHKAQMGVRATLSTLLPPALVGYVLRSL